jgi:hypothetical protein
MTELATRDPLATEIARAMPDQAPAPRTDTIARLAEWAEAAGAVNRVATGLVDSSFVPVAFRNKPIEATAAIMAGMELGFSPMASLGAFDVIQGRAAPRAITIAAVLQSCGHEMRIDEWTDDKCVMSGRRKGETTWTTVEWTTQRADMLGLLGKDQWKKQKRTMLRWRCTSELGRIIAADALLGIPHSAEELRDLPPVEAEVVSSGPITLDDVQPAPPTQATPSEPDAQPAEDAPVRGSITDAQLTKLAIALKELGMTDRAKGLAYLSDTIGRPVSSSKELTKTEASKVIEALAAAASPVATEEPPADPWNGHNGDAA